MLNRLRHRAFFLWFLICTYMCALHIPMFRHSIRNMCSNQFQWFSSALALGCGSQPNLTHKRLPKPVLSTFSYNHTPLPNPYVSNWLYRKSLKKNTFCPKDKRCSFSGAGYGSRTRLLALGRPHNTDIPIPRMQHIMPTISSPHIVILIIAKPAVKFNRNFPPFPDSVRFTNFWCIFRIHPVPAKSCRIWTFFIDINERFWRIIQISAQFIVGTYFDTQWTFLSNCCIIMKLKTHYFMRGDWDGF